MRTTIDIPVDLLDEAKRCLAVETKREAVIISLQEAIRRRKAEDLISLFGTFEEEFALDLAESRRRPKPSSP